MFFSRFFKSQDPIQNELRRLEREKRELTRLSEEIRQQLESPPVSSEEPEKGPSKPVYKPKEQVSKPKPRHQGRLKVQQKIARNRIIFLGVIIAVLIGLVIKALNS